MGHWRRWEGWGKRYKGWMKSKNLPKPPSTPPTSGIYIFIFDCSSVPFCLPRVLFGQITETSSLPHSHFSTVSLSTSSAQTPCHNLGAAKAAGKYWFPHNNTETVWPSIFWRLLQNVHFEGQVWLDRLLLKRAPFLAAAAELLFATFCYRKRIVDARNFFYSGK